MCPYELNKYYATISIRAGGRPTWKFQEFPALTFECVHKTVGNTTDEGLTCDLLWADSAVGVSSREFIVKEV